MTKKTKKQLISLVAAKAHLTQKAAREAVEVFVSEVVQSLRKREKVVISGFGTFKVKKMNDKPVVIPGTKEKRMIKSYWAARFLPGKPLKKLVK